MQWEPVRYFLCTKHEQFLLVPGTFRIIAQPILLFGIKEFIFNIFNDVAEEQYYILTLCLLKVLVFTSMLPNGENSDESTRSKIPATEHASLKYENLTR